MGRAEGAGQHHRPWLLPRRAKQESAQARAYRIDHQPHPSQAHQPIFDYHTHLSPKDVAENGGFGDLADIWLSGDHYK